MSTQPFGAAPPPATPTAEPEAAARRSPLLLFGAPALAALLVAGGLSYVLLGGASDDGLATGVPPTVPAPSNPTPSPSASTEAPRTLPLSASRNPFDPLVREPVTASTGGTPAFDTPSGGGSGGATGGTGGGSPTTSTSDDPPVISFGGGSTTPGSGSSGGGKTPSPGGSSSSSGQESSTGGSSGGGAPSAPTPSSLDAAATCKAGDDFWATYYTATQKDLTITHTMAGNVIGPVTDGIDKLATATSVEELRQPLRSWARASAAVRTQLVSGAAVRDIEPVDPLKDASGGTPKPGVRPTIDQASVLLARTAVRERCYQLTDPLVKKDSL